MFNLTAKSILPSLLIGTTLLTGVAATSDIALAGDRDGGNGKPSSGQNDKDKHYRKDRHNYQFHYKGKKYYCKDYYRNEPSDKQHGYYYYCVSKDYKHYYSSYDEKFHRDFDKKEKRDDRR